MNTKIITTIILTALLTSGWWAFGVFGNKPAFFVPTIMLTIGCLFWAVFYISDKWNN